MADERIDVVVTDKVDEKVATKLNQIADAADRGTSYLNKLKAALANVNATAIDRLASAMAKADGAQARLISAQARLTNAQNNGSVAAEKVALAQQKIATEAARTEAATQRAAQATSAAALAAQRLSGAASASAGASASAANAQQQLGAATGASGAAAAGAGNQWRQYITTLTQGATASNNAAAASTRLATGLNSQVPAAMNYQRAARQTTAANANIIAQMQDIGVSLAGGQNPLLVMIQQGSQLSYIASTMQGGWTAILGVVLRLAAAFAPLLVVMGALYLAMDRIKGQADAGMKDYIASLGLTEKEVEKLKDTHVTFGDVIKATWQEVGADIAAATGISGAEVSAIWKKTVDIILATFKALVVIIYSLIKTLVVTIGKLVANIGIIFYNAGIAAKNLFLIGINALVKGVAAGMNAIGGFINQLSEKAGLGSVVGQFNAIEVATGGVRDGMKSLIDVENPLTLLGRTAVETDKYLTGLGTRITNTARRLREANLAEQARKIKRDRPDGPQGPKPKEDNSAQKRIDEMNKINLGLDNEIARMSLLKDARAIQQRMDSIEEGLTQKKITLNDAERASILAKVTAIEMYKYQQAEMDRIYEEATGPLRTYNATLAANNDLLARGAITAQQASQNQVKANRTYAESQDPLFAMKETMLANEHAAKLYGAAVEQNNYYEQLRQQYLARGIVLGQNSTAAINAEVAAMMARNAALIQQTYVQQQMAAVLNPFLEQQKMLDSKAAMYAELERLRQSDLGNERMYQQAKWALDAKFNAQRLQGASDMFGSLAQLSSSGNKKLAAIGKAAAVAQATIQGIQAVQNALATPAPWPLPAVYASVAAAMAGANVAKILSTPAGSYKDGGQFMVKGKDGVDANNINMNVTKGERVTVETAAQQRANDNASAGGQAPAVNVKAVTVFDPRNMLDVMDTSEGERVIMQIVERRSGEISRMLGG